MKVSVCAKKFVKRIDDAESGGVKMNPILLDAEVERRDRMQRMEFPMMRRLVRMTAMLVLLGLVFAGSAIPNDEELAADTPGSIEFVGQNMIATANGQFHVWRIIDQSPAGTPVGERWAEVEVDLASVDTGISRRDDHLRDPDFFEVTTWPIARIRAHSLVASKEANAEGRYAARFDIDLHGIKKTLEGEVTRVSEVPLVFEGSLIVNRLDFGVGAPPSRWNPMSVDVEIPVRFRVEL
jgi:polyisoprenoid-binding protein YceI